MQGNTAFKLFQLAKLGDLISLPPEPWTAEYTINGAYTNNWFKEGMAFSWKVLADTPIGGSFEGGGTGVGTGEGQSQYTGEGEDMLAGGFFLHAIPMLGDLSFHFGYKPTGDDTVITVTWVSLSYSGYLMGSRMLKVSGWGITPTVVGAGMNIDTTKII
ncbi:MAG: hypothetical protein CVT48_05850 [Thermoplasmata archaeon HGW-Thermoplasmata-1]|nr:MAG: hypothetical protein CVT48_05850 [Thermoplasmata archaeon HGW-Thermoplasmata-1]